MSLFQVNSLCIWSLLPNEEIATSGSQLEPTNEPRLLCNTDHPGDVTDLKVCVDDALVNCS